MEKLYALGIFVNEKSISILTFDKIKLHDDGRVRFYNDGISTASIEENLFKHNLKILNHSQDGNTYRLNI